MEVVGNPALLFSAVGAQTVLGEGLGGTALSLSSPDSGEMVGRSGAAAKGGALDNTGGMTSLYTELTMLGQEQGVCEDSRHLVASIVEEILLIIEMQS